MHEKKFWVLWHKIIPISLEILTAIPKIARDIEG